MQVHCVMRALCRQSLSQSGIPKATVLAEQNGCNSGCKWVNTNKVVLYMSMFIYFKNMIYIHKVVISHIYKYIHHYRCMYNPLMSYILPR